MFALHPLNIGVHGRHLESGCFQPEQFRTLSVLGKRFQGEYEDVRRGLCFAEEGGGQALAECSYDKFGDRAGENCGQGSLGAAKDVAVAYRDYTAQPEVLSK